MSHYQYDGSMAEKVASENPLTDENLNLFADCVKTLDAVRLTREMANPKFEALDDDEYWQAQKELMVKTMEASKRQTGRF